jgi:hypothetical protein
MKRMIFAGPVLAAGLLAAQPCIAASDFVERRPAAFAGLNFKAPIGDAKASRPTARLQLTTSYDFRDSRNGAVETVKSPGLEFGMGKKGKPTLFLNGQDSAQIRERMNAGGSTTTWVIVGGVAVLALVVLAAYASASSDLLGDCPTVGGLRDHCIDP